jgi:cold shock CspA family protein
MLTGTILFFNRYRGYGFCVPDNGSEDLFFPFKEINLPHLPRHKRILYKEQRVSYVVKPNERNPEVSPFIAGDVTPLEAAPAVADADHDAKQDGGAL